MKKYLYFALSVLALLVFACSSDTEDISEEYVPDDLSGKVVYQKTSPRAIKVADVNSLSNAIYYDDILSGTRPVWSHDGTKFAAINLRNPSETGYKASDFVIKIVDVESDSTTIREIGSSFDIHLRGPLTWSPDGSTIAFLVGTYNNSIMYLDTENGDIIQPEITGQISGDITALDWHTDGDIAVCISFWHDYQNDIEIWMLEPFTTTLKTKISAATISRTFAFEFMDWNSEGSKLLLSPDVYYEDIEVLDFNTGKFTSIPNISGIAPCWSPDGKYIMYTGISGVNGSTLVPGLFVTNMQGSFEHLLIKVAGYSDWY